jgi:hypothetical protein
MSQVELISRLLPSIPELDEILQNIRVKYLIEEVRPENKELIEFHTHVEYVCKNLINPRVKQGWSTKIGYRFDPKSKVISWNLKYIPKQSHDSARNKKAIEEKRLTNIS